MNYGIFNKLLLFTKLNLVYDKTRSMGLSMKIEITCYDLVAKLYNYQVLLSVLWKNK